MMFVKLLFVEVIIVRFLYKDLQSQVILPNQTFGVSK